MESIGISCASILAEYPFRARKQSFVNHLVSARLVSEHKQQ